MLTVIMFSSIFIYVNEDLKTKLDGGITGDQWLIPYIILVGTIRAIIEVKHSRDARIKNSREDATLYKGIVLGDSYDLRDLYKNKPMRGPSALLGGILLFYNLWYGDWMGNGYSLIFSVALVAYLSFVVIEKVIVQMSIGKEDDDYEWGYGNAWATIGLASTVMVIFSAFNLAERINEDSTVEGALVAALGAVILDVTRLGYGSRSFSNEDDFNNGYAAAGFRLAHALVGVVGLMSVYAKETIEDAKVGVVEPLRLFVVVASLVKVVGFFYSLPIFSLFKNSLNIPLKKQNVENTLRQGSTIVLLMSSILLENWSAEENATGWGTAILITAIVARLVDCIQDSLLEFGVKESTDFLIGNYDGEGKFIMSPSGDNPRSWLVLGGLITALVLIIQVTDLENSATDPGDSNKLLNGNANVFDGWLILSMILVLAHVLLVVVSIISSALPSSKMLKYLSLSRVPLFRTAVTTTVLIGLTVCAGQINLGYDEVASTSPSASTDFKPNWSQLHLLAAIVVYIFTDLVGHVFL